MAKNPGGRPRDARTVDDQPTSVDRIFGALTSTAGVTVLVLLTLVGVFLLLRSRLALGEMGTRFFSVTEWSPNHEPPEFGVAGLVTGTVLVALVAFTLAVPFGVCTALFITDFAPAGVRRWLTALVDLLAAIPSLLYGIWGSFVLGPQLIPVADWLTRHLDWIPIFRVGDEASMSGSIFIAGVVVSLMVLPIIASVTREVFAQTPEARSFGYQPGRRPPRRRRLWRSAARAGAWCATWCSPTAGPASSAAPCSAWAAPSARRSRCP